MKNAEDKPMKTQKPELGTHKMQRIRKEAKQLVLNYIENSGAEFECEHGCKHHPADICVLGMMDALVEVDLNIILESVILALEHDDQQDWAQALREFYRKLSSTPVEVDTLHYEE